MPLTNLLKTSPTVAPLKQSGIRAYSTRCAQLGGINLGQGICDLPTPENIKEAAYEAIKNDKSIYSPCEGIVDLRQAIAQKMHQFNNIRVDPQTELVITHGSTGAFVCAAKTLFMPGDEVVLFEPFYGYHKNILALLGVGISTVTMDLQTLTFTEADLNKAITAKTKGVVICTPNNPSGKVFTESELKMIGQWAQKNNLAVLTDEIYEYITYPGYRHISPASLPEFAGRTVTISGFSKTYNMTGWRLGYAAAPAEIAAKMALVQDLLYVCPPTPLQYAVVAAFALKEAYYGDLAEKYLHKREFFCNSLTAMGFKVIQPQGAYYVLADVTGLGFSDDEAAANFLLENAKVASVPGRSFFANPEHGKKVIRFCYAINDEKLKMALGQMQKALASR